MVEDSCTLFPDGSWGTCCARHDKRYENTRLTKYQADTLLYRCVKRKANPYIAVIIFIGVSTPFSWLFYYRAQDG